MGCKARLPLLFLSNNDPIFVSCFCNPYFGPFFPGHKPTHVFKTRILGADWLGDCLGVWINYFVIFSLQGKKVPSLVSVFSSSDNWSIYHAVLANEWSWHNYKFFPLINIFVIWGRMFTCFTLSWTRSWRSEGVLGTIYQFNWHCT